MYMCVYTNTYIAADSLDYGNNIWRKIINAVSKIFLRKPLFCFH